MLLPIIKFIQYNLGNEAQWNAYNQIIPKGAFIVYKNDQNDILFKLGDGIYKFSDLPVIFNYSYINAAYAVGSIDPDIVNHIGKLLYLDSNLKITASPYTVSDFELYFKGLLSSNFRLSLLNPIINGPSVAKINNSFQLSVTVHNIYKYFDLTLEDVEWTLPDATTLVLAANTPLVYNVPNDSGLIGSTLFFEATISNIHGQWSRDAEHLINIDTDSSPYVIDSTVV